MQQIFSGSSVKNKDCYVADYTHYNNGVGVIISDEPFADVEYFHLMVAPADGLPYLAVNIEEYDSFKKGIQNCEAMFVSQKAEVNHPRWVLFLELKYCREQKIEDYGPKAISQMDAVRQKLLDLGKLDRESHVIHFNYCSPNNSHHEPFDGFKDTQNATLSRVESDGVIFHARMELVAIDGSLIIEPEIFI